MAWKVFCGCSTRPSHHSLPSILPQLTGSAASPADELRAKDIQPYYAMGPPREYLRGRPSNGTSHHCPRTHHTGVYKSVASVFVHARDIITSKTRADLGSGSKFNMGGVDYSLLRSSVYLYRVHSRILLRISLFRASDSAGCGLLHGGRVIFATSKRWCMASKPSNQYLVLYLYTSLVPFVHKYHRWVAFCTDRPKSEKYGSRRLPKITRFIPKSHSSQPHMATPSSSVVHPLARLASPASGLSPQLSHRSVHNFYQAFPSFL